MCVSSDYGGDGLDKNMYVCIANLDLRPKLVHYLLCLWICSKTRLYTLEQLAINDYAIAGYS